MIDTSEILVSKEHIDPLRDQGFVIYKLGRITPVEGGKREAKMLWGNVKGGSVSNPGKLITQAAHGFIFENTIKRDGVTGLWILSKADTRANAGTVGIVSEVIDADHFRYITGGLLPGEFVDGADYWLSTTTAGAMFIQSDPEVWEIGNVREFIGTGTATGLEVEIDLGDEITETEFATHKPVTIAASSTGRASINENQELTINDSIPLRIVEIKVIRDSDVLTAGDAKATFTIPLELNGYKLIRAEAAIKTVSSSGLVNLMIRNATAPSDMLSTPITIDQGELNSYTAATPSVVNNATNTVSTGNMIAIDADSVGVGSKGLDVILTFNAVT